jgi:hypothetical protein
MTHWRKSDGLTKNRTMAAGCVVVVRVSAAKHGAEKITRSIYAFSGVFVLQVRHYYCFRLLRGFARRWCESGREQTLIVVEPGDIFSAWFVGPAVGREPAEIAAWSQGGGDTNGLRTCPESGTFMES